MNINKFHLFNILFLLSLISISGQDLSSILQDQIDQDKDLLYSEGTFKATRVVLNQSVENVPHGELVFLISHHFGNISGGFDGFFGLDQASIRLGFEYGLVNRLSLGIGRNSYEQTYDGFVKIKVLRQHTGITNMPLSLSWFSNIALNSEPWSDPDRDNRFGSRICYVNQVIVARKFSERFSLQLMPSHVHRNLVETTRDQNVLFALGMGGRFKIANRISINGEYHYLLPGETADIFNNSLSIGFDIETGGHVFQLHFSNSQALTEKAFIAETEGDWGTGDFYFGFHISRVFNLKKR